MRGYCAAAAMGVDRAHKTMLTATVHVHVYYSIDALALAHTVRYSHASRERGVT